jgi:hypothetical protein
MNTDRLKTITSIEVLEIAEEIAIENVRAIRQRIDELTHKKQPDELLLVKYAREMFDALLLAQDADHANSQPFSSRGLCSPDNPFGQSTAKMPDGRLVDRSELHREAAEAVESVIAKVCGQ